jgi:ABC-type lipopolysaccharide export system ATPase subunit
MENNNKTVWWVIGAVEIVHRAYILDKGRVVKEGEPKSLMESGLLEKVFLGKLE